MSTTGDNHPLLPNTFHTTPLETWAAAILQRLSSEAEQCHVKKVEHYKALPWVEHEFLVVYASHPSGSEIVLGVDRSARNSSRALTVASSSTSPSPLSSSSSEKELRRLAKDNVRVSHNGNSEPILDRYPSRVLLFTITFPPPLTPSPSLSPSSFNSDASPPSLLHLSVLLLTIHTHFPSYDLLEYQCYFFASMTCLASVDLFSGVVKEHEGKRAATWRGVHVSHYSATYTVLKMLHKIMLHQTAASFAWCLAAGVLVGSYMLTNVDWLGPGPWGIR